MTTDTPGDIAKKITDTAAKEILEAITNQLVNSDNDEKLDTFSLDFSQLVTEETAEKVKNAKGFEVMVDEKEDALIITLKVLYADQS